MIVFDDIADEDHGQAHKEAQLERVFLVEIPEGKRGHGGAGAREAGQSGRGLDQPEQDAVFDVQVCRCSFAVSASLDL